jgi:hypothetical protein
VQPPERQVHAEEFQDRADREQAHDGEHAGAERLGVQAGVQQPGCHAAPQGGQHRQAQWGAESHEHDVQLQVQEQEPEEQSEPVADAPADPRRQQGRGVSRAGHGAGAERRRASALQEEGAGHGGERDAEGPQAAGHLAPVGAGRRHGHPAPGEMARHVHEQQPVKDHPIQGLGERLQEVTADAPAEPEEDITQQGQRQRQGFLFQHEKSPSPATGYKRTRPADWGWAYG